MILKLLKLKWLRLKIEKHWMFIQKYRKKGILLINRGVPLSSPEIFSLSDRLSKHNHQVMRIQKQYENLRWLTTTLIQ